MNLLINPDVDLNSVLDIENDPDIADRDSLHALPLWSMPLANSALRRARLVKNVRLETRLELFGEDGSGSGQIEIDQASKFYTGGPEMKKDIKLLKKLAALPAFDCHTLRRGLREAGINVADEAVLSLSEYKQSELFPFMRNLTRPLIRHLYGGSGKKMATTEDLIKALSKSDSADTLTRIEALSNTLGIRPNQLPNLLEDLGDAYLSLSYYRSFFTQALPKLLEIKLWIREAESSRFARQTPNLTMTIRRALRNVGLLEQGISDRFVRFDKSIVIDWQTISIDDFETLRSSIINHQASMAEVLCGIVVKIQEWETDFPNGGGGAERRCDFIAGGFSEGLEHLAKTESSAPTV